MKWANIVHVIVSRVWHIKVISNKKKQEDLFNLCFTEVWLS